jgi:hypothetical protein
MTGAAATPAVDRHVVIVTAAGSFTPAGERLTGPVTGVDKLETLIDWTHGRGLLQPSPSAGTGGPGDDAAVSVRGDRRAR